MPIWKWTTAKATCLKTKNTTEDKLTNKSSYKTENEALLNTSQTQQQQQQKTILRMRNTERKQSENKKYSTIDRSSTYTITRFVCDFIMFGELSLGVCVCEKVCVYVYKCVWDGGLCVVG